LGLFFRVNGRGDDRHAKFFEFIQPFVEAG
jgi:hypothetical protein